MALEDTREGRDLLAAFDLSDETLARLRAAMEEDCPDCSGKGGMPGDPCTTCLGEGRIPKTQTAPDVIEATLAPEDALAAPLRDAGFPVVSAAETRRARDEAQQWAQDFTAASRAEDGRTT